MVHFYSGDLRRQSRTRPVAPLPQSRPAHTRQSGPGARALAMASASDSAARDAYPGMGTAAPPIAAASSVGCSATYVPPADGSQWADGSQRCAGSRGWRGCRKCVGDRYHRRPGRSWSRYDRGRRSGDRYLGRCHRGSAGAQRYTGGRTAGLGAIPAGSTGRTEPGTAAVPADGRGVRADEGHRHRRHVGSRSTTRDGRVRVGERLHTRTRGGTAAGNGRRPAASP